jgi:hypothetical protein
MGKNMTTKYEDQAAFPSRRDHPYPGGGSYRDDRPGMALRDYFAARAMQAQLTAFWAMETHHGWSHDEIAREAYAMADAMIVARGET